MPYCTRCRKDMDGPRVWDHGKPYHPDCFFAEMREKMTGVKPKEKRRDWSEGVYET